MGKVGAPYGNKNASKRGGGGGKSKGGSSSLLNKLNSSRHVKSPSWSPSKLTQWKASSKAASKKKKFWDSKKSIF